MIFDFESSGDAIDKFLLTANFQRNFGNSVTWRAWAVSNVKYAFNWTGRLLSISSSLTNFSLTLITFLVQVAKSCSDSFKCKIRVQLDREIIKYIK